MAKDKNTGSAAVQIEGFTVRIKSITEHLSTMRKDHSSRRGLLNLVSKRRKLLKYLKRTNTTEYVDIVNKLKLRK
tara:strand:- start:171 stop:395 length:225 start_codon:yes stop_codon:yes gene_type:complete